MSMVPTVNGRLINHMEKYEQYNLSIKNEWCFHEMNKTSKNGRRLAAYSN